MRQWFDRLSQTDDALWIVSRDHGWIYSVKYHLERPDSSYPHLELAFHTPDIVKLNTFPPASTGRFPPEEQELLSHTDGIAVGKVIAFDVGPEACKSNTANHSLVGLAGTVTPVIVVIEATKKC